MVAQSIYDTLTRPNAQGEIEPWLAESVEAERGLDRVDHHAPRGREVPRRQRPHRRRGQEQPRRLPRPVPGAVAAAVRLRVRADPERRRDRSADRAGHDEAAVGLVRRPALRQRAPRHDGPGPARRHRSRAPTTSSAPARSQLVDWVPNQKFEAEKNPDYWATDAAGNQLPYLDAIEFRPIVEIDQRLNALQSGEINAMHTSDAETIDELRSLVESGEFNAVRVGGVRRGQLHHAERGQAAVRQHQGPPGSGLRVRLRRDQHHHQRRDHHPGDGSVRAGQHRQPRRHGVPDLRPRRGRAAGRRSTRARPARTCRSPTPRPMRRPPSSWAS